MRSFKAWMSVEVAVLRNCFFRTLIFLCMFTFISYSNKMQLNNPLFIVTTIFCLLFVNLSFILDSAMSLRKDGMIEAILTFKFPIPTYPLAKLIIPTVITTVTVVIFSGICFISGNNIFANGIGIYVATIIMFAALVWSLLLLMMNLLLPISLNISAVNMLNMLVPLLAIYAILTATIVLLNSMLFCILVLIMLFIALFCIDCLLIKFKKQCKRIATI